MNQANSKRQILYRLAKEEKMSDGGVLWTKALPQPYEFHTITKHYFICRIGNNTHIYDRITHERILGDKDISYASEVLTVKNQYQLLYTIHGTGKKIWMDIPEELQKYSSNENLLSRWIVYRKVLPDGSFDDNMPLPEPYVSHNQKGNCLICRRANVVHIYDVHSFERLFLDQTIVDAYEKDGILFICLADNNWKAYDTTTLEEKDVSYFN